MLTGAHAGAAAAAVVEEEDEPLESGAIPPIYGACFSPGVPYLPRADDDDDDVETSNLVVCQFDKVRASTRAFALPHQWLTTRPGDARQDQMEVHAAQRGHDLERLRARLQRRRG